MQPEPKTAADLTPEQREALMEAFASVTKLIVPAIEQVLEALKPIIEAYNRLPVELKNEIGMRQVIDDLGDAVAAVNEPEAEPTGDSYYHACDCTKKGVINVYHFSDCAGGEACELYRYLNAEGNAEKHLKRGHEYTVTKDADGQFVFEGRSIPRAK